MILPPSFINSLGMPIKDFILYEHNLSQLHAISEGFSFDDVKVLVEDTYKMTESIPAVFCRNDIVSRIQRHMVVDEISLQEAVERVRNYILHRRDQIRRGFA